MVSPAAENWFRKAEDHLAAAEHCLAGGYVEAAVGRAAYATHYAAAAAGIHAGRIDPQSLEEYFPKPAIRSAFATSPLIA